MSTEKVIWTEEEVQYVALKMYHILKDRTFQTARDKSTKFQKAFVDAQKSLPAFKRKKNTFRQDMSGVADALNELFESANKAHEESKESNADIEKALFTFADLLMEATKGTEERLNARIDHLEAQLKSLFQILRATNTTPIKEESTSKLEETHIAPKVVVSVCVVGLLQSRERLLEDKLSSLPVRLSFCDVDSQKSFPKQPCHDYVIFTKHSGHSQYEKFQKVYGSRVTFVNGGFTNIQRHIQKLISNHTCSTK